MITALRSSNGYGPGDMMVRKGDTMGLAAFAPRRSPHMQTTASAAWDMNRRLSPGRSSPAQPILRNSSRFFAEIL